MPSPELYVKAAKQLRHKREIYRRRARSAGYLHHILSGVSSKEKTVLRGLRERFTDRFIVVANAYCELVRKMKELGIPYIEE